MPTPTQINTDDITDLKNSNQRVIDALHLLEVTVTQRFGQIGSEMERRFGQMETRIDANHAEVVKRIDLVEAKMETRIDANHAEVVKRIDLVAAKVDTYAGLIKWSVTLAVPIVVAILGSIGVGIWYAAKLDFRVGHVEQIQAKAPK